MRLFFLVMFVITSLGCVAVTKSLDNYNACVGDPVCVSEMAKVKSTTHAVVETTASSLGAPTAPEFIAVVVSNLVSFGFGVLKGKKKKGG